MWKELITFALDTHAL